MEKDKSQPERYFLGEIGVERQTLVRTVAKELRGAEDGELYLEYSANEHISWLDGRIKEMSYSDEQGFGLRRVNGEEVGYAYGNRLALPAFTKAGRDLRAVSALVHPYAKKHPAPVIARYPSKEPFGLSVEERKRLLEEIDGYLRTLHGVVNVAASLNGNLSLVMIVRADGEMTTDVRPLVRFNVGVQCEKNGKREWGNFSWGGRNAYQTHASSDAWKEAAHFAYREANDKLDASACPAGEMPVVLGPGWPAVILHEAIGHGLEGDAVRKGESVFGRFLGERVASEGVTVFDDGTIPDRRGSLSVDDEGTAGERTVLIERGKLVSFMHDRQSARHFRVRSTGNARRQSYEYPPLVRMRNTYMLGGAHDREEMIREIPRGLFMPTMGGGQVDPVTGKFVFEASIAYMIEGGKIGRPVKGATLIGNCVEALRHIDRIGNDFSLDRGTGTCGKGGQGVPVGVGQPSIRLAGGVVVGGTETE